WGHDRAGRHRGYLHRETLAVEGDWYSAERGYEHAAERGIRGQIQRQVLGRGEGSGRQADWQPEDGVGRQRPAGQEQDRTRAGNWVRRATAKPAEEPTEPTAP